LIQLLGMFEKPINWRGSAFKDIKDDGIFSVEARKEAGHQLNQVQMGLDPDDWKPFDEVGAGTKEIRINLDDGWFRVMYVAKFPEAVYVLHCFKKKSRVTSKQDKEIASSRYKAVIKERIKK
jgi:phage-related protein